MSDDQRAMKLQPDQSATQGVSDRLAGGVMALLAGALWLVNRPYHGIYHDARLYTLQALARLRPDSLAHDVFLRFGSQDAFTIFSPFYARVIDWMGVEPAARLLTLVGHAWWLGAASAIALRLLGRPRAWLAVALLAALPGYYGAWEVFRFAEPFLTARLFAEAAVLTSVALILHGRRWAGVACASLAVLLHPLMGMAGLLILVFLLVPRRFVTALATLMLGGLTAVIVVAVFLPTYPLSTFDQDWLSLVRSRSPILMMQDWSLASWKGIAASVVTLWMLGSSWQQRPGHRLFESAIIVACLGLVVTGIGASIFKIVILTQGQAWRWVWVAHALVPIAAALGFPAAWRSGPPQRAALFLLMCGWVLVGWPGLALLCVAAVLWAVRFRAPQRVARGVEVVCIAVGFASALAWWSVLPSVSDVDSSMIVGPASFGRPALYGLQIMLADGVVGVLIVTAAWLTVRYTGKAVGALLVASAVFCTAAIAVSPDWLRVDYSVSANSVFYRWRDLIPVTSEVFWPDDAAASWLFLERSNYMSADQTAGIPFSRPATMEMRRRASELSWLLPASLAFNAGAGDKTWRATSSAVRSTCLKSAVDFIVTGYRLDLTPASAPALVKNRDTRIANPVYLYDCRPLRITHESVPAGPVP